MSRWVAFTTYSPDKARTLRGKLKNYTGSKVVIGGIDTPKEQITFALVPNAHSAKLLRDSARSCNAAIRENITVGLDELVEAKCGVVCFLEEARDAHEATCKSCQSVNGASRHLDASITAPSYRVSGAMPPSRANGKVHHSTPLPTKKEVEARHGPLIIRRHENTLSMTTQEEDMEPPMPEPKRVVNGAGEALPTPPNPQEVFKKRLAKVRDDALAVATEADEAIAKIGETFALFKKVEDLRRQLDEVMRQIAQGGQR